MVAPPKRRAPHKAIHYRTRDKGTFRNGAKSGGGGEGGVEDEEDLVQSESPRNINSSKHNQELLNIFRNTYYELLTSSDFTPKLQAVKQALFERDFAKAFGDQENLEVYAARWSPTRALCYASVFAGIRDQLEAISTPLPPITITISEKEDDTPKNEGKPDEQEQHTHHHHLPVLAIGGCAAELVAFGSLLSAHLPSTTSGSITLLDSGPWGQVITSLAEAITAPPPVSKYASAAVKARGPGNALIHPPSRLVSSKFVQQDVLTLGSEGLSQTMSSENHPSLITLLFTLNELFTAGGIGRTTKFLMDLTSVVPFGSLLLVVDSPGSYSETTVGKEAKRYPMQWLLDRIILGTQREPVAGRRWKKLESHDAIWFRLDQKELDYPIPLENMRYQMHLYKVQDASLPEGDDE
ncbi:hypothetical protein QBC44DRAFT_38827 [Cladorrhinum sp. PSN332]|nr:hypothetical protein QBC44DRAFT_38827 [Cladorrhinum sp. PSN332]